MNKNVHYCFCWLTFENVLSLLFFIYVRTFFVEYDFPTSTPSHNEEKDINMATELTRIASKNIQDGSELFF